MSTCHKITYPSFYNDEVPEYMGRFFNAYILCFLSKLHRIVSMCGSLSYIKLEICTYQNTKYCSRCVHDSFVSLFSYSTHNTIQHLCPATSSRISICTALMLNSVLLLRPENSEYFTGFFGALVWLSLTGTSTRKFRIVYRFTGCHASMPKHQASCQHISYFLCMYSTLFSNRLKDTPVLLHESKTVHDEL